MSVQNMMQPIVKSVLKLVIAALKNVPQWPAKLQTSRGKRSGSTWTSMEKFICFNSGFQIIEVIILK